MDQRALLLRLKEVDQAMRASETVQSKLGRISSCAGSDELLRAQGRLGELQQTTQRAGSESKRIELEIGSLTTQVKALESKLYAGASNPRELALLQQKLAETRVALARLEDRLLELICSMESSEEEAGRLRASIGEERIRIEHQELLENAERTRLQQEDTRMLAERAELISAIGPVLSTRYEKLRQANHGIAVAQLDGDRCSACHMVLSEDFVARVQKGDTLQTCESCGRIVL